MRQRRSATMRMCSATLAACRLLLLAAALCWPLAAAAAQELALASRGPRFLRAPSSGTTPVEIDVRSSAVLRRTVSLNLERATVGMVLAAIERQTGLSFMYSKAALPLDRPVRLRADSITVAGALMELLVDSGMDVLLASGRQVALVERRARAAAQQGAIVGRVADRETGLAVPGVMVLVEGTRYAGTTGGEGRYRIAGVPPGAYTVSARRIGYEKAVSSVVVSAEQEATADFALAVSASVLDRVVVTGTVVPTEQKALPTPVSVITAADIERQHVRRSDQLLRQLVPSALAWDSGPSVEQTTMSVRGTSTLQGGLGGIKVYLDGIEISDRTFAAIDPNSIERIEVIRGPQAAAVYGSDAIGGVMQVFTKRVRETHDHPRLDVSAAMGPIQSPYEGGAMRQDYRGTLQGGNPLAGYNIGGSYTRMGEWVPGYTLSNPSLFGGLRYAEGPATVDLSARFFAQSYQQPLDPRAVETGLLSFSKPLHRQAKSTEQTYGGRLTYAATSWWQHGLTLGIDRYSFDFHGTRPRYTTPADTFLLISVGDEQKASVSYNSAASVPLTRHILASVVVGADHYELETGSFSAARARNNSGSIATDPRVPPTTARELTRNTGYFGQLQLAVRDALYLTGAIRAERNTNFGSDFGTALSPRAGLALVRQIGPTTIKLRASYGEAIQPPAPGMRTGQTTTFNVILPNPQLSPERQKGTDGGVDLSFGGRGSIGITYYNQTAQDLIQTVLVDASATPPVFRNENVAMVKNSGVELEGTARVGGVSLSAQYAITNSRARELGPSYSGDLRVGEQLLRIPHRTGGALITVTPFRRTTMSGGLVYVGERTNFDQLAQFRCSARTGPCRAARRDYLMQYPAFTKVNLTINQELGRGLSGYLAAENVANSTVDEISNSQSVPGRVTMVGFRFVR